MLTLLAAPRVQPYKTHFKPANDDEHLGAYMWGQAVSASFHPFLGIAEVVLRNAIHETLSTQCSGGSSTSYPWYDRALANSVPIQGKSLEKVEALLCSGSPPIRKAIQPSPDKVISELTFGIWPNVMEGLSQRFAPRAFTAVFPNHPNSKPQHWSYVPNKAPLVLRLKRLQDLRNRVAHFEPVWKPHWLGSPNTHWSHSVQALRQLHTELLELVEWSAPDAVIAYKGSFGWNWFNRLCTTNAVTAFMSDQSACGLLPAFPSKATLAAPSSTNQVGAA
ncbi:hypothetical protein LNV09_14600 [Paucibacter sp. B2R-40]|uniref:hypothetical protein n=1 Tax=Paucibacter sp. B2R-40 TaxID=2893554 RepID=UPI0021E46CE9|nr:hypothetical protein [Paucibacter sp. B2R-40]MCV2355381.1 hypothetical protein [Paucibacter sp. B2R-40]